MLLPHAAGARRDEFLRRARDADQRAHQRRSRREGTGEECAVALNEQPKALAKLHTEGTLPHEGIYDESVEAEKDLDLMRDAALAWRATGDDRYLRLVDRLLYAWVTTYQPSFNPIDETHFEVADPRLRHDRERAARQDAQRGDGVHHEAREWLHRGDRQRNRVRCTGTYRNNWQSHRIKLIAMAAFTLDNRKMINAAQRLFVEHIGDNIAPDGSTVDFAERDALHYVTYDLQPLVTAALAARRHNRNWLPEKARERRARCSPR